MLRPFVLTLAFLVLGAVSFGGSIAAPFDFDDGAAIVENATIHSAWPPTALVHTPPLGTATSGRPIVNYSFALNYALNRTLGIRDSSGVTPTRATIGFHAINILLHLATAFLLLTIVKQTIDRFFEDPPTDEFGLVVAAGAAVLWLVHPIQTEAVDYISQRTELLASLCYLGTLYASIRVLERRSDQAAPASYFARWVVIAGVFCAVGMGSKEITLTVPLAVALYDAAFCGLSYRLIWSDPRRRWLYLTLVATAMWPMYAIAHGARGDTIGFKSSVTWYSYAYSQGWAIAHYLRLIFWPVGFAFDYGQSPISGWRPLAGTVVCVVLFGATIIAWTQPRSRWLGFLGFWFFLLLAPSSSILPIRTEIAAERRVYLASASVFILAALALAVTAGRAPGMLKRFQQTKAVAFLLLVGVLATLSARRSLLYRNLVDRWTDGVATTPRNGRAYDNLASALLRADPPRESEAAAVLRRAMLADSGFVPAWVRAASIATAEGQLAEAESLSMHALRIHPNDAKATEQLGKTLLLANEPHRAIVALEQFAQFDGSSTALARVGIGFLMDRQLDSAILWLGRAERADPNTLDVQRYLGAALVQADRGREAVPRLERLVKATPQSGITLGLLALAYAQSKRAEDAIHASNVAVLNASGNAVVYVFAGRALETVGEHAEAVQALERAVQLAPNDAEAFTWLGIADASTGDRKAATAALKRALVIAPGYVKAIAALAALEPAGRRR